MPCWRRAARARSLSWPVSGRPQRSTSSVSVPATAGTHPRIAARVLALTGLPDEPNGIPRPSVRGSRRAVGPFLAPAWAGGRTAAGPRARRMLVVMAGPPEQLLAAFDADHRDLRPLRGGQGTAWGAGSLVFKPLDMTPEALMWQERSWAASARTGSALPGRYVPATAGLPWPVGAPGSESTVNTCRSGGPRSEPWGSGSIRPPPTSRCPAGTVGAATRSPGLTKPRGTALSSASSPRWVLSPGWLGNCARSVGEPS